MKQQNKTSHYIVENCTSIEIAESYWPIKEKLYSTLKNMKKTCTKLPVLYQLCWHASLKQWDESLLACGRVVDQLLIIENKLLEQCDAKIIVTCIESYIQIQCQSYICPREISKPILCYSATGKYKMAQIISNWMDPQYYIFLNIAGLIISSPNYWGWCMYDSVHFINSRVRTNYSKKAL